MELNQIYLGDCLDRMKEIGDKSIDFILTDLPYAVTANKSDILIPFEPLWENYKRVIKDNGVIALFAQGIFYVDLVCSTREWFKYDLVWDKILTTGFLNTNKMPLRSHEQIAIFYNGTPTYNPQKTQGKPLHSKGTAYKTKEKVNNNYGDYEVWDCDTTNTEKFPKSILTFQKPHPSVAQHRTEKAIPLLEWLINTYTNKGDTVLDSCCGSGTTCIASFNTGRNFIGIEKDVEIYEKAKERLRVAMMKKRLF
jgi:site-specific DNA-methyltransferase (adenine-specific)